MRRVIKTCEAAEMLGVCYETLRKLRMRDKDFPQPLGYARGLYDALAIEAYLDKRSGNKPKSVDYDAIVLERLAKRGSDKGEISRH
jgi:hypothetical protein